MKLSDPRLKETLKFYSDLDTTTSCINWKGWFDGAYGRIKVDQRKWRVHRLVWTLTNGDIPEGLMILHKCDNPKCINIDHLFIGTAQDNMTDKVLKGRAKGNPAKLSLEDKKAIQRDFRSLREIAVDYNTSISVVHRAKKEWL